MKIYKRVLSLVIALALIVGLIPISAITANAYSWTLTNGGTVTSGQTATITCYGGAAYQITNFEWDCTSNTIATITGTDANGEVIYTRQINGSPYLTKTFCYGGEQYVIEVIKGSIEIGYTIANTAAPKITVTENYSDLPVASAYDYILVENSTSDDDYFYVTVAYNLVSHEQGAIMFGVESNNSGSFTILADLEHVVSAGVGRHTFTIPREEVNDEDVYVNISPYPHGDSWNPLDADEFKLKLTSSDDLLNQRENYYTITKPTFSILGSGENQLVGQDGYIVNYNGGQYTTNSTGRVLIPDTNDPTEDVLITKEGYYDHKIPKEVIRNFNRVYMHKNTVQEPYLDNFYMRYDGSNAWENVLYNSIYFTEMSSQAFDIYVSANWCGQSAMKIYLQQGDVKLELTEGFNENVILGSSFSATGGTIYLCLETVGKTYKFSPKIFVDNYNLELDMDLGSQDEAEISDDIQGVGGEKLKISCSMLDFLPVGVSVAADGTVTGTIGIKAEDKHQATWYDEIKKSVSSHDETKIAETFKKLKKAEVPKWESKSSIGIGVDMSIIGYFTAHVVKESPNPDLVGTLQIDNIECAISIEGNVSASVQQFYGVVPVYWATELGLKLAFAFEMQKETPESSWEVEMPRMEIEISISGSGSLGVSKIVGAGLKASGAVTITIHAPDYNFDSSSCYVQVTTYVIGEILTFKGEKDFWESDKEYLWGEEYEDSLEATSFSLFSDLSRYRVASVLNEETENKEVALQTEDGVNYTKNTFDSLSYSNSSIQTAKLSNGKTLFVWVDSVPSRLDINKAALYYTVFDPSTNEYSEVQMVKDDGTSDFTPQLTVGENGVYLVWANISDVADNDMSLAEFSSMMEIAFMEFDAEDNTFINYMQLTDNSSLDMIPYAAESNGLPYVVWVNDVGGNLLATSNQVNLVAATFDGTNWNTTVLQEELNSITSMVAVSADEGVDVYYTMDNDLDYSTGADQELYRYAVGDVVQVTENECPESDLKLVDGNPVWLSNGCVTSMDGLLTNRFTANVYGTATYDGGVVTLYSEPTGTENASESIYAVFTHNGITGVPIKVADTDSIVRSIDAYFDGGNLCFYTTENSIVDGVVNSSAIIEYSVELPNTLVITGTSYNDYSLKSNGELVANVSVRNLSSLPIEKYLVTVYDDKASDVRTTRIYVPTASGDKKTLEISIPIPSEMEEEYLTFGIQPVFLNGETGEVTEGIVTIYPYDVSLEDFSAYNENSGVSVTLSVVNRGIKPIDNVEVFVYKMGDENTEIYSTTISQIDVDDTEIIEFVSNDVLLNDILYATATSPYIENIVVNNEIHTAVINTPAQDSQMEETDNILNLDESRTLELSSGEYGLYAFIPEEDGWYAFFSEGDSDTYGYLYDGSMNQLQADDEDGEGSNFKIIEELVGGETYFIKAKFYSSYRSGSFDLKAIKLVPAESIVIEQGDLLEGYPFESTSLSAYMTPDDIIPESYTWSSNDTTVVTVNSYGNVSYKAPGTATITVTSDSGLTDTIEVTVKEFPDILLNDTKTVVIDENQKVGYFKFTPEEDGWYAFYSVSEGDTYCYLYNATGSQLAYDNNNGDNSNFRVEYKMTAGETYVYKARYNYSSTTGSFDVKLEKMLAAESVAIVQGDSLSGYHGESFTLTYEFAPVNCIEEKITWTSSNQEVATVNSSGIVSLLTTGTVEITATSENGLTDVCTISVIDYPTIIEGEQKTVEITELQKNGYFYFTPETDGTYIFYSISDSDTFGYLLNSEGTTLKSDDESGDGSNFEIEYALTGGETYILKCKYYSSSRTGSFDVKIVEVVDAEAIQITNGETYSGQIGSSYQLTTQFLPDGARDEDVSWTSTDSSVVSVSSTGYINLKKEGSATITVTSSTGLTDSITVEVTGYPAIILDQEVVVSTDENLGTAIFSFEPTVTGTYVFYSYDNDFDTYGHLYDSEMNQLTSNDDGGNNNNFKISYKLVAGQRYYYKCRPYSNSNSGSYAVQLNMVPAATSMEIGNGDTLSLFVGDSSYFWVNFAPDGSATESVSWVSENSDVVAVDNYGNFSVVGAGTTTITATSENGLTDSIVITANIRPAATSIAIGNGDTLSAYIGDNNKYLWVQFSPDGCATENVTWTSDDASIVSVDQYGNLDFVGVGTTTVTATSENGLTDSISITVKAVSEIQLDSVETVEIATGGETKLYTFTPTETDTYNFKISGDYYKRIIVYTTSTSNNVLNTSGYEINRSVELTANTTYRILTYYEYSDQTGTYTLNVSKAPDATSLTITNGPSVSGYVGDTRSLYTEFGPEGAVNETVTWESDNTNIATVDQYGQVNLLAVGTATITATSENGLVATCVVEVKNIPSITCDEDKILNTNSDSGTGLFSFVPEVDGMYVFYSYDNDFDTYGYILDENMNTLDSDDDNGEGNNFKVVYSLVAGTQYYLKAKPLSSGSIGEYRVKVVKLVPATSVNIIPDGDINIFEGYEYRVDAEFDPENSIEESCTWTSSDTSVATIDSDGNITAISAGTTTITVTTENGLNDSIIVTVRAPEEIELDETKNATLTSDSERNVFSFIPDEDGQYIIKITGDYYTQTSVQDSEMNWINSNSGYYYSFKVTLSAEERYNISTYLWDDAESGDYNITIEKLVPATSLEITQEGTDGGYVGDYGYLYTNFGPENAIEEEITWVSSNPEVAVIESMYDSSYIRVNFVSAGTTTITATSTNGLTDTIVITVAERPSLTSIEIGNGDSLTGYVGIAKYLWVNFYPDGAAHEQLTWSSDNEAVATVNEEGKVELLTTGTVNITVVSESGLSDTCTITVGEVSTLTIGQPVNLTIVDNEEQYVKFVPTESGLFRIYVSDFSNSNRARITLFDSSMNWLVSEYDEEFIDYEFVAGQTYYIETNYCSWSGSGNGTYNLNAIKPVPATSISFDIGSEYNGYVGTSRYVNVIYAPDHAITESITWSSTDSSIVSVNRYGEITLNAVGTATITATSENGLVFSCVVTVEDFETIEVGQEKDVVLDGDEAYFYFTPDEDGYYSFYSYDNDHDTYGYILNSDMEIITSDDDGGDGNNFKVRYQLEAGVTYVLKARFYNTENSGSFKVCVEQTKYVTALEIVSQPDKTEYVEGFVNEDNINYYGLKLKVTWSDGSTTDWKYNYDWSVDGEYIYRDASNVDETGNVELTCGEATVTLTLTIIENPVDHIEIVSGTKNSYVENYNGYIDENQDGEFFYYYNSYPSDAVIKIVYKNGTSETARVGDTVNDYSISWEHNQYNEPWVVGTNNKSIVTYLGHTVILPITVKENTVTGIEVVSGKVTCIENAYGYDTGNGYYYYYGMPSDVTLRITYSDGTSKVVSIHDVVDGYNFNWEADQYETPWTLGDDNYVTVTYLGQETQLPVSVISSPVDRIVINAAPSREYIYGDREYGYLYSDGEYEFYPTDLTGLSFTVYYVDGTSKTFTADDIDEYGEINGYGYELYYDEYNAQIGDFPVQFMYMGKTADYVVKLKESTVSSIAVTKQPNKTEFGNYYSPDFIGMELTITYTDGSTKVVTLTEDNLVYKYNPWWGELTYTVDVDGSSLTLEPYYGEDDVYFVAYYLGASCDIIGITYTEEKEIDTIELDKVSWNGDGMTVKITYTDESTETLTLDLVDFFDFEDSSGSGYGMTDKGLLYYYIETDYDNNGRPEEYRVSIFNRQITVEADAVIIGDVNGDGAVDNLDRLAITRYLADWDGYTEADINMAAADVNNDGSVDNLDRLALTRHLANWEGYEELPIN